MQPQFIEPERLEQSLDALLEEVHANTERVAEARRRLDRQEITGQSSGGEVTARLLGSGRFVGIDIDPAALRHYQADGIGSLVLEAINDGLHRLDEISRAAFAPYLSGG